MPSVPASWQNAASPSLTGIIAPSCESLPVTTTHTAGNWMLAVCAWVQTEAGQGATVSVNDDAFNRWEPLGAPSGDSDPAGPVRISLWYAPAARVGNTGLGTTTVMCAPTAPVLALGMMILDLQGMHPWDELAFLPVSAFGQAATTLSLTGAAPVGGANALAVTACAADTLTTVSLSSGSGWTTITGPSISGGTASEFTLDAAWKTMTIANSVTWTAGAAADLAAIMGAVVVLAAAPTAPNPNWPIVITEIAPGAGPGTPPSEIGWQAISGRSLGFSVQQGQPYLLGGLQAATGALVIDNPDLAATPPGNGVWAGIDSGTPLRVRAVWPSSSTPHYVRFSGYLQQAPTSFDQGLRGQIQSTITDAYAYATAYLAPCLQAELLSEPTLYALWPCNDPAGSAGASNRAPGNQHPLTVQLSKFGNGAASQAFGQNTGALIGDSGSGMWGQSGVASAGTQGNSLVCADSGYPPISGGVTVEGWFQVTSTTPSSGNVLTLMNSVTEIIQAQFVSGNMVIKGFGTASNFTTVTLSTITFDTAPLWHLAIAFNRTSYVIYVNGTQAAAGSWTFQLPAAFTQLWANGTFSATATNFFGKCYNGYTSYIAVFGGMLQPVRIAAHYEAGTAAFSGEYAHQRIERILGYANLTGPRVIVPEGQGMPGGFSLPAGADLTPMSSMATIGGTTPAVASPGQPGFAPTSGTQASQALTATAASTLPAVFCIAPTGASFYYPRGYAAAQPTRWVLGDSFAAGEIPIEPDAVFPYDPGTVKNDIQLSQPDTGTVTVPGIPEQPSVAQYGDQSYQVTAYLLDDATSGYTQSPAITDLANWVACAYYSPRMRATAKVIASSKQPALAALAWPFVLGAAPGDIVTINTRPPTAPGAVISVTARIVQVKPNLTIDMSSTEGSLQLVLDIAPELNWLTCDSVTQGLLNGVDCLGW